MPSVETYTYNFRTQGVRIFRRLKMYCNILEEKEFMFFKSRAEKGLKANWSHDKYQMKGRIRKIIFL